MPVWTLAYFFLTLLLLLASCQEKQRKTIVEFKRPTWLRWQRSPRNLRIRTDGNGGRILRATRCSSCVTMQDKPGEFGDENNSFTLQGHGGQFVGWFGIVRDIERNSNNSGGFLLIENKYSMGLTDCDIQTVEINGGGDFKTELATIPDDISFVSFSCAFTARSLAGRIICR